MPSRPEIRKQTLSDIRVTVAGSGALGHLPVGTGAYELRAILATGGMAELIFAERVGQGGVRFPVVVKRLRDSMLGDPTIVRMFEWEAWIASRLRHPNVVSFHDFVVVDRRHHLILEYVEGCDLAHLARAVARADAPFPLADAVAIVQAVALALDHAHNLRDDAGRRIGLVHRDVSPHNVVLSTHGAIKIIDFGVAKTTRVQRDTGAGLIKGKMGYHAPEQLRGEPIDGRSDIFGLGVVLAELVIGARLHPSDESLAELLSPRIPPILELRPDCPEDLAAVITMALQPKAASRFASARAMASALHQVQRRLSQGDLVPDLGSLMAMYSEHAPPPTSVPDPAVVPTTPRGRPRRRSSPTPIPTLPDGRFGRLRR